MLFSLSIFINVAIADFPGILSDHLVPEMVNPTGSDYKYIFIPSRLIF
jgi:hypothetical protein